jgi:FlaA1/EpsC-like NDP-sugar epimerase|tara:strand:+ start:1098 stop:2954 length:1857 start_codon:yes stop_codon:yes gene_type:complete
MSFSKTKFYSFLFKRHYSSGLIMAFDFLISITLITLYYLNGFDNFKNINVGTLLTISLYNVLFLLLLGVYNSYIRYLNLIETFYILLGFILSLITSLILSKFQILDLKLTTNDLIIIETVYFSSLIIFRFFIKTLYDTLSIKNVEIVSVFAPIKNLETISKSVSSNEISVELYITPDEISKSKFLGKKLVNENSDIDSLIEKYGITRVIIDKNYDSEKTQNIYEAFKNSKIKFSLSPDKDTLFQKRADLLKNIPLEKLLDRNEISVDIQNIRNSIEYKTVLVTGGAGSIGSEIVNQIIKFKLNRLIIIDKSETDLFNLKNKILSNHNEISYYVDDICDENLIKSIFKKNDPQIVFHAAAYKHVYMMEDNPSSAIKNNVRGTEVILENAILSKAEKVVIISSDKAVNPSNIMGASKRIAELLSYKYIKKQNSTKIITTRFGNVLGSNGSVIQIFEKQISQGNSITITDKNVTRYFMTIPEACSLVLEASTMGGNGEIFVFDMGKPVKIIDIALKLIRLKGLRPYQDVQIEEIGLRPGEKLYEELLTDKEKLKSSHNKSIYIAEKDIVTNQTLKLIDDLIKLVSFENFDNTIVVKKMKEIVPEFISMNSKYEELDEANDL